MRAFLLAAALLAAPAIAVPPPPAAHYETGALTIAGQPFAPADVLDARAMPDPGGTAGIMLTLSPKAAQRLEKITAGLDGKQMIVTLDGKTILNEMMHGPIHDGVIEIPGSYRTAQAEALARRISGKDPLPDDLAE